MYSLSSFPAPAPTPCQGPQLQAGIPLHSPSSLVLVTAPSPCLTQLSLVSFLSHVSVNDFFIKLSLMIHLKRSLSSAETLTITEVFLS